LQVVVEAVEAILALALERVDLVLLQVLVFQVAFLIP
jgi:hypothetical protein